MSGKQFLYLFLTVYVLIISIFYFYQAKTPKQGTLILGQTSGRSLHEVYVRGLGDGIHEPPSSNSPMGRYENAAIATDHAKCSKIGKDMMYNGGSAVDGAIAAMLCIGVLHSQSAGIGGGSLATIYDTKKRDVLTLDCREEAPSISNTHMFVQNMDASLTGGLAIGVPSQVACYKKMHELYGTLPWKALFQPTIEICREGFKIGQAMGAGLERQTRESLNTNPGMKIFINPDTDEPYQEGDYLRMPDLADTLELIAEKGAQEFYHGDLARSVVNEIQEAGGRITLKDLRSYNVLVKRALNLTLANGNYTVLCPPPPSGGATLLYVLNILDGYNFSADSLATTQKSVLTYHRIIEAFKFAFAKRSLLGDERFTNTDEIVKLMMSKDYAAHIRDIITDEETHDYNYYGAEYDNVENHGTSHLSILGPDGIAVSLTSTINTFYGSKVLGTKTGILYNNDMDDFATPYTLNHFGIPASPANYIKPGKRPMSSMAPTIITDREGRVVLIIGASGGSKINSAISYNIIQNLWLGKTVKEAVDYPRIHHQLTPPYIEIEHGFPKKYINGLLSKGHDIYMLKSAGSISQAIHNTNTGHNSIHAISDYRKGGRSNGF